HGEAPPEGQGHEEAAAERGAKESLASQEDRSVSGLAAEEREGDAAFLLLDAWQGRSVLVQHDDRAQLLLAIGLEDLETNSQSRAPLARGHALEEGDLVAVLV